MRGARDPRPTRRASNSRKQCFAHGLMAIFAFNRQSTLQIMPPLVISAEEIDEVLERLDAAVAAMGV